MDGLLTEVGRKVRTRRQQQRQTLKDLAKHSGLSERFLGNLEAGRANISVLNLAEVAQALGLPMGHFFELPAERVVCGVISLLGLRGAGKSSVGKALADRLDLG